MLNILQITSHVSSSFASLLKNFCEVLLAFSLASSQYFFPFYIALTVSANGSLLSFINSSKLLSFILSIYFIASASFCLKSFTLSTSVSLYMFSIGSMESMSTISTFCPLITIGFASKPKATLLFLKTNI